MATKAQILALSATTFPRIGRASDSGEWYIIAANELGSTAQKFGPEIAASLAASGIVELATIAEGDTGTDTTRAVTPSGLAGSALQTKINETANKIGNIASLTLIGDATNNVKSYALDEWSVYGVMESGWGVDEISYSSTSLHIGQGITVIGSANFTTVFTSFTGPLVIPSSVTSIEYSAFEGTSGFTSLVLNEGLLTIGNNAFDGLTGVTGDLVIPNSVTAIGLSAFDGGWTATGTLTLGSGLLTIGDNAFEGADFTGSLVVPEGVTSIGESAFRSCGGLTSLTIPSSVTTIGSYAFLSCTAMTTVTCHTTRATTLVPSWLLHSNVSTIVADAGKGWTAGSDTIGGRAVTVTIAP